MAEQPTTPSTKPAETPKPAPEKAPKSEPAKPFGESPQGKPFGESPQGKHAAAAHKKEPEKAAPAPARNPVEQWLDAYLPATLAEAQPKKFAGTMEVTEFVPQIRLALKRTRPPLLANLAAALAGVLAGLGGAGLCWVWLPPGVPRAAGLGAFAVLLGFSLYRLLHPPVVRLQMDSMINRLQWWNTREAMSEITFVGCQFIELVEQRGLRGFRCRIVVEPRWGGSIPIAATAPRARREAFLNALELVRGMVQVMHLPVRVRLSRLALGARLELPPVPERKPTAPAKPEEEKAPAPSSH